MIRDRADPTDADWSDFDYHPDQDQDQDQDQGEAAEGLMQETSADAEVGPRTSAFYETWSYTLQYVFSQL